MTTNQVLPVQSSIIFVTARVIGYHYNAGFDLPQGKVLHVQKEQRPAGPGENAFLYAQVRGGELPRARYISWINLNDLDHALEQEPAQWRLDNGDECFESLVEWHPFGWNSTPLPNVAYILPCSVRKPPKAA